jgi:hypothetical protein
MAAVAANNIATGQVTMTGAALLVAPARSDRKRLTLIMGGTGTPADTFLGGPGVAVGAGVLLAGVKGQAIVLETTAAVFGNGPAAAVVTYIEEFA